MPTLWPRPHTEHAVDVQMCIRDSHHPDQRALAHSRATENADPLAAPHTEHAVDGADPGSQGFAYWLPIKRRRRRVLQRDQRLQNRSARAIKRLTHGIHHATDQGFANFHARSDAGRGHRVSVPYSIRRIQGHREHIGTAEANHLCCMNPSR